MRAQRLGQRLGLGLAAAVLLTGCGDANEDRVTIPTSEGVATVTSRSEGDNRSISVAAPDGTRTEINARASAEGFPAFAQPYPGAAVESAQTVEAAGERGGMLSFATDAPPDTVVAWYRQQAEAAGLVSGAQVSHGGTRSYQAEAEGVGANLVVVVTPTDERSSVLVTWSSGG